MNYRHAEMLAAQDLTASGTKIIDVDLVDPISRITLLHRPVGGGTTQAGHPVRNIEKVEIVDGSEVIESLSGYEAQAINIFEAPSPVVQNIDIRTGGTPMVFVNFDFGRYLWDPELALDPKKFNNPQLKLTWNEVNYDADCTAHSFMLYAHVFDEKAVSPVGFLMNKEIKSFEPSSGAYEYTDLPTDRVLRKLVIQALKYNAGVRGVVEEIRLSEDNDKRIPIDGDIYDLRSFLDPLVGEAVDNLIGIVGTDTKHFYVTPSNVLTHAACPSGSVYPIGITIGAGTKLPLIAGTGDTVFSLIVRGKNPHGCICIPFGNQSDPGDWYDVTRLGNLKLRLKGGTSSASGDTVNIVTQQLRMY